MARIPEKGESDTPMHGSSVKHVVGDKPEEAIKFEDAGPPGGGTAAWLVLLGAWCCSFTSLGWINFTSHFGTAYPSLEFIGVRSFQQYYEVGPLKEYSSSTIA